MNKKIINWVKKHPRYTRNIIAKTGINEDLIFQFSNDGNDDIINEHKGNIQDIEELKEILSYFIPEWYRIGVIGNILIIYHIGTGRSPDCDRHNRTQTYIIK